MGLELKCLKQPNLLCIKEDFTLKFTFKILLSFLLAFLAIGDVFSVQPVESPQATSVGPRFRSLGYNVVSVSGDVTGVFTNPAALSNIEYMQISAGNQSHLGYFEYNMFNVAYPYKSFVFSLSYASNMLNNIPLTRKVDGTIYNIGSFNSGWKLIHFGFSDDYYLDFFLDKFSYGISAKLLQQELSVKRRSIGVDVGVLGSKYFDDYFGINEIVFGVSVLNAFATPLPSWSPINSTAAGDEVDVAREIFFSTSYHFDKYNLVLHQGISGFLAEDYPVLDKVSFGADYALLQNLNLRGSVVRYMESSVQEFNLGLGFLLDGIAFSNQFYMMRLDYNYTIPYFPFENEARHAFGISLLGQNRSVVPQLASAKKKMVTNKKKTSIKGKSEKNAVVYLYKNDVKIREITASVRGEFEFKDIDLNSGNNRFYVRAQKRNQDLSLPSKEKHIDYDAVAPEIAMAYSVTKDKKFIIATVTSSEPLSKIEATLNNQALKWHKVKDREYKIKFLFPETFSSSTFVPEEQLLFTLAAKDYAGNETAPYSHEFVLSLIGPQDRSLISNHSFMVSGSISDIIANLYIQGEPVAIDAKGHFAHTISSGYGKQLVKLNAITHSGVTLNYYIRVLTFKRFEDLTAGFPEKRHVELLATMGFLNGDPDKNFRPDKLVTRRELVRLVVKLLKLERPFRIKEDPFFDVKKDDKDAGYILAGVEEGIMFAFPDGNFKPDQVLTVSEAFEILVNNDILDTDDVSVDRAPCTRLDLAQMMKSINQYNERVEYLLNWDKGFKLN